jgi:hypothetical protein
LPSTVKVTLVERERSAFSLARDLLPRELTVMAAE